MNASSASLDHGFHQFKGIEHATKTGFSIGHDGREVVDVALVALVYTFGMLDFVGTAKGVVDALNHGGHRVNRVQRLVRVHRCVAVVVRSDLPARQINGFDAGFDLLHGLTTGEGAQAIHVGFVVNQVPELFSATASQSVLNVEGAAQAHHISRAVTALDALPAWVGGPVFFKRSDLLVTCQLVIQGLGHGGLRKLRKIK